MCIYSCILLIKTVDLSATSCTSVRLHDVTVDKTVISIVTTVRIISHEYNK